jgi:hypothetical protein
VDNYSEVVAQARSAILRAQECGVKSTGDIVSLWGELLVLGQKLSMSSVGSVVRFNQTDFDSPTWKALAKLCVPLEKAGCVERRSGDRRGRDAFILKPDVATEEVLTTVVHTKREYKKKSPAVVTNTVYEKGEVRIVHQKPARKEAQDSRAVVIDIANVTKRHGANGRPMLPIDRINWNAFRNALQMHHEKMVPLERLVLCVSAHYYATNRFALAAAERVGFTVVTKYGDKEADPVVVCELMNVVHKALVRDYLDRIPTIVLVSGDADFSGVIHSLRELVKWEGLSLPIHVVSWEDSLSLSLELNASKTTALDGILKQIRLL